MNTLVLIRGWASVDYTYAKFLKTKPANWKVKIIAADELIYDFNLEKAADRLQKIINEENLDNFVLAGHSLGGAVALAYSAKYPQHHSQIIIINSVGVQQTGLFLIAGLKMTFQNSQKAASQLPVKIRETLNVLSNPYFHFKLGKFARDVNILPFAGEIQKPVLILYGDQDQLVSLKTAQEIQNSIKNSKLQILSGLDHDWISFYPEKFWEILEKNF